MESGQLVHVFSSWEVIVSCLLLLFLLPIVFFVASARSPVRRALPARMAGPRPARKPAPPQAEPSDDLPPSQRARRGRDTGPADDPEEPS
jgi:hypothetical protein